MRETVEEIRFIEGSLMFQCAYVTPTTPGYTIMKENKVIVHGETNFVISGGYSIQQNANA